MVLEVNKYKAQYLQIAGFAFMSPFGALFFDLKTIKPDQLLNLQFILYAITSFLLVILGIIFLMRGIEILKEKT